MSLLSKKKYDIFISYRRDNGGTELARILYAELKRKYSYRTFFDFPELKDNKFSPQIFEAIDSAPIFVFVLSENSLDRCADENDWVRKEILYAKEQGKHIVPVNPEGKFKFFPKDIPVEIVETLAEEQHSIISLGSLFDDSVRKLVKERVRPYLPKPLWKRVMFGLMTFVVLMSIVYAINIGRMVRNDKRSYDSWLKRAESVLYTPDSIKVATGLVSRADSLRMRYCGTIYEAKFGNKSQEMRDLVKFCRDSLFDSYKTQYKFWFNQYLDTNTSDNKRKAIEYIDKALFVKYDKDLFEMRMTLKE